MHVAFLTCACLLIAGQPQPGAPAWFGQRGKVAIEAAKNGDDKEAMAVIDEMAKALAAVKIVSFGMYLAKAEQRELADGTPYVLVPTEVVMDAGDGKTAVRSHTLALMDADVWYLMRVSDQEQLTILRQVYPEYAGVEFPSGSVEALKE